MNKNNLVIRIGQRRHDINTNRNDLLIGAATGWIVSILGYMIRRDPKNNSDVQIGTNLMRIGDSLTVCSTLCTLIHYGKQIDIQFRK